ncbi:hypothetical protein BDB01DRAFT_788400 [Pilobolus umbonatus]|nr:hypothetical protein BDB01DRAFT_788400 [Pilobolus umbonatus]
MDRIHSLFLSLFSISSHIFIPFSSGSHPSDAIASSFVSPSTPFHFPVLIILHVRTICFGVIQKKSLLNNFFH